MTKSLLLSHDLGTTGNKASLYTNEGKVLASAYYEYSVQYPHVTWVEQNPEEWWQAVCASTKKLLHTANVDPDDVACVSFSGQMMGCVVLDRSARPLRNAIIWADQRGTNEAESLIQKLGKDFIYRTTGHRASPSYSAAKILWVRNNEPEIFSNAYKFVHAKDFIVARLTGNFVTDYSDASGMNLYNLETKDWSAEILDATELDRSQLPELHASTDVVGEISLKVSEEVGLKAGTPVVIGGGDGPCAAVGAGVVREGSAYNYIGSSSWIGIATCEPIFDPDMRTFTWAHLVPGMFSPTGTMQAAGGSYQWLREVFCLPEKRTAAELGIDPYELMNLQARVSPAGAKGLLFLPYLLGERSPRWNPNARGAYIGLNMQHNRSDVIRATLEGITFNLRVILDAFTKQGANIPEIRVIGGGARGEIWRQIMADIFNIPVLRPALLSEATSMGAAIAGGVGIGLFKDFSIAEKLTPIVDRAEPRFENQLIYSRLYSAFNKAYEQLVGIFEDLSVFNQ